MRRTMKKKYREICAMLGIEIARIDTASEEVVSTSGETYTFDELDEMEYNLEQFEIGVCKVGAF